MAEPRQPDPVYRITNVDRGLTEEQAGRQRRYLISMAVRTACFVAAIITSGPLRWVFLVAALFLPYIAVVIANAGRERTKDADLQVFAPGSPVGLTEAPGPLGDPPTPPSPDDQGRPSGR